MFVDCDYCSHDKLTAIHTAIRCRARIVTAPEQALNDPGEKRDSISLYTYCSHTHAGIEQNIFHLKYYIDAVLE